MDPAALMRRFLSTTPAASRRFLSTAPSVVRLRSLEDGFRRAIDAHVVQTHPTGAKVVFASAWLATDNIVVHLLHKHYPELLRGMTLLGVDTLHLFDDTHTVARQVQAKYGKPALVTKPRGCETREDFVRVFGDCEELDHAEFDLHSKVRALRRSAYARRALCVPPLALRGARARSASCVLAACAPAAPPALIR